MYNRYIPGTNGYYERKTVTLPKPDVHPVPQSPKTDNSQKEYASEKTKTIYKQDNWDMGDLLLLAVIILLLIDSEEDDFPTLLLTAVAFLFLQ